MAQLTVEECISEDSPGRLIRAVHRELGGYAEPQFAKTDLTFSQWLALKINYEGAGETPGELARELKMTSGAVTRLLDVLEARQFLERHRDADDRRLIRLILTASGITKVREMALLLATAWNGVLTDFDQAEFANLIGSLKKVLAAFERHRNDFKPNNGADRDKNVAHQSASIGGSGKSRRPRLHASFVRHADPAANHNALRENPASDREKANQSQNFQENAPWLNISN